MVQTGHPDWLRTPVGINSIFVNKVLTVNTNGTILGTFYVSDYPHLSISFDNGEATAHEWIELRWNNTNDVFDDTIEDIIEVGPSNALSVTVPVKGLWVQVLVFSDVATVGASKLLMYGTTSTITPDINRANQQILISDNSAYLAGANKDIDALNGYAGPVLFSFDSTNGTAANVDIKAWDVSSKSHQIYATMGVFKNSTTTPVMLYVPPRHLRLSVFNIGAAQNIRVLAIPAPLWGS